MWPGFGIGTSTGVAFLGSCQNLPPCPTEWEGSHVEIGEECGKSSPDEERAAETMCDKLTTTPVFIPLYCFRQEVMATVGSHNRTGPARESVAE